MKVLVISTSLRENANSDILAAEFVKGAQSAGHTVEKVSLIGKKIGFCTGCLSCLKTKTCVIYDDANDIIEKMNQSDVVVFASPVYYGGISGQLKTLLDRTCQILHNFRFRDVYLILTCDSKENFWTDNAIANFNGWFKCDDREKQTANFKGIIRAAGVLDPGDINGKPDKLKQAFEMGMAV